MSLRGALLVEKKVKSGLGGGTVRGYREMGGRENGGGGEGARGRGLKFGI